MFKTKLLAGILLIFMLLTAQVGMAAAAPLAQDATITGTIQDITTEIDANGATTVLVTLVDNQGAKPFASAMLPLLASVYST